MNLRVEIKVMLASGDKISMWGSL